MFITFITTRFVDVFLLFSIKSFDFFNIYHTSCAIALDALAAAIFAAVCLLL